MINVMFVCHGNICRSPAAELIFNKEIENRGLTSKYKASSCAISSEEIYNGIGNQIYPPVKKILDSLGLDTSKKRAIKIKYSDYDSYDYFICMDDSNYNYLTKFFNTKDKIYKLYYFDNKNKDVLDPWYTRDFSSCIKEIKSLVLKFIDYLLNLN